MQKGLRPWRQEDVSSPLQARKFRTTFLFLSSYDNVKVAHYRANFGTKYVLELQIFLRKVLRNLTLESLQRGLANGGLRCLSTIVHDCLPLSSFCNESSPALLWPKRATKVLTIVDNCVHKYGGDPTWWVPFIQNFMFLQFYRKTQICGGFSCFQVFLLSSFCLFLPYFSSLPLLFDILKPKKVPTRWGFLAQISESGLKPQFESPHLDFRNLLMLVPPL